MSRFVKVIGPTIYKAVTKTTKKIQAIVMHESDWQEVISRTFFHSYNPHVTGNVRLINGIQVFTWCTDDERDTILYDLAVTQNKRVAQVY